MNNGLFLQVKNTNYFDIEFSEIQVGLKYASVTMADGAKKIHISFCVFACVCVPLHFLVH
jgi:hypothetical protein